MSLTTTPATPATPATAAQSPGTISLSAAGNRTPGTWRHPRLDEIARRQRASVFSTDNVRTVLINSALLFATCASPPSFLSALFAVLGSSLDSIPPASASYSAYALALLRLLFVLNITVALAPVIRRSLNREDDMADIPLTPSQRKLLGLNPTPSSSAPPTPRSGYVTPPRYTTRSASGSLTGTPRSDNSRGAAAARMQSASGSGRNASFGSPFASPYGNASPRDRDGSPLLHKAIGGSPRGAGGVSRRWSHGSNQSPLTLGRSGSDSLLGMGLADSSNVFNQSTTIPGTPTPAGTANKREGGPSVTLNSKWLYERGRNSLGGRGLY